MGTAFLSVLSAVASSGGRLSVLPFEWFYQSCVEEKLWGLVKGHVKTIVPDIGCITDPIHALLSCCGLIAPLDLEYVAEALRIFVE